MIHSHAVSFPIRLVESIILLALLTDQIIAQQPAPPPRSGRSYNTEESSKTPPPPGPRAPSPVTFTNITALKRINFKHSGSPTALKYLLETMGGGVAMLDYDNDGRMDLFFTNGARLNEKMSKDTTPDKTEPQFWNRLYHQTTDGSFEDVTVKAGVKGEGYSMGVAAGDYDNDGNVDLYVTAYGGNTLFRNKGDGTFTNVTKALGVSSSGWSTSAGWLDFDRDGRLDLFVSRYLDWDFEKGAILCGDARGTRAYCHPENFRGETNVLFRQTQSGGFEDVSRSAGIEDPNGKALGVAFADFDNDGNTDIFVANDSVRQSLYHNKGNGKFADIAVEAGAGYDEDGKTYAGMGVDAADYDNDGYVDIVCTTLSYQTYPLYRNNGDLSFTYVTKPTSVGQISFLYSGWGTRFLDIDNDGLRDIFVAQSHVLDTIEQSSGYLKYKQTLLLMRNLGTRFTNVSETAGAAFNLPLASRGAAFGDLDNDGQLDAVIAVLNAPSIVLRNNGTKNHWLGISLVGSKSNRDGFGARVIVTEASGQRVVFDASTAGSYLSASDPRMVVGLGKSASVRTIEVRWPSGIVQIISSPEVDRYLKIEERDAKTKS